MTIEAFPPASRTAACNSLRHQSRHSPLDCRTVRAVRSYRRAQPSIERKPSIVLVVHSTMRTPPWAQLTQFLVFPGHRPIFYRFTPSSAHRCRRSCGAFSHHGSYRRRPSGQCRSVRCRRSQSIVRPVREFVSRVVSLLLREGCESTLAAIGRLAMPTASPMRGHDARLIRGGNTEQSG
jgi:hypothetical protein